MKSLQVLSGDTFDPVHYGHLKSVEILANLTDPSRVIIMPNNVPSHRAQSEAPGGQRQHMVELIIADKPLSPLNEHEPERDTTSHTTQTLKEWREEQRPRISLAFIISQDSLPTFPSWHDYDTILGSTHLIVCQRPGYPLEIVQEKHQRWLEDHLTRSPDDLYNLSCGKIYLVETSWLNISATLIRECLEKDEPCDNSMPAVVLDYTNQQGLYR